MATGQAIIEQEIRHWLKNHPVDERHVPDLLDVPADLFDLAETDEPLCRLNRQIRALSPKLQRLLLYLSRDLEPALIIESMDYRSPELFWLDKALLVKEIDPSIRQQDVRQVFEVNGQLLGRILDISDQVDREEARSRTRRRTRIILLFAPAVLALLWFVAVPLVIRPDAAGMYQESRDRSANLLSRLDTLDPAGADIREAVRQLDGGNPVEAAGILESVINGESEYRSAARWFRALVFLRQSDPESCSETLRVLRQEDPGLFRELGKALYRKL